MLNYVQWNSSRSHYCVSCPWFQVLGVSQSLCKQCRAQEYDAVMVFLECYAIVFCVFVCLCVNIMFDVDVDKLSLSLKNNIPRRRTTRIIYVVCFPGKIA